MIGYYGGSFNPVHIGHIEVAKYIASSESVKKVLLTPVLEHPLDKETVPFEHRIEMLKLATNNLKNVGISDVEKKRNSTPSYTYDLLTYLKQREKNFFFIAGLDNLNSFFKWKNYEKLLNEFNMVFTTRANTTPDKKAISLIEQETNKKVTFTDINSFKPEGISFLTVPDFNISSSSVRKMLMDNKNCSGIIHRKVLDYIKHHNLYIKR
jgi:nicotinate-nucleotide adenylyltransferase